jgi:hypothetical protein
VIDTASSQLLTGRRFLYDGWNLIAEFSFNSPTSTLTTTRLLLPPRVQPPDGSVATSRLPS